MTRPPGASRLVISYLTLRKAVGVIGMALPFVLAIGNLLLEGPGLQSSISAYYHTPMRDVLVGSLCAVGVFLLSYRGYDRRDDRAGDLACVFAVGAALFPVAPEGSPSPGMAGGLHLVFAGSFFLTLAYFSLALFRRSAGDPTPRKLQRNRVYTVCGWVILGSLALIAIILLLFADAPAIKRLDPVFYLEGLAILAFGVSWFTKGEGILEDRVA